MKKGIALTLALALLCALCACGKKASASLLDADGEPLADYTGTLELYDGAFSAYARTALKEAAAILADREGVAVNEALDLIRKRGLTVKTAADRTQILAAAATCSGFFGDENANAISTWNATSGRIAVSEGGTLRLHEISLSNDLDYGNKKCSVEFAFDDGVLDLCRSGSLTTTLPDRNMISVASGGMEIVATNGIVQTVSIPVKGGGTIVKTGSGSLAFVEADSETPTALAEFTGLLNVREGSVTLSDGTEGTSYRLMVASGAVLAVEGSGAIRLAPKETSAGTVDLNGNAVTVDFGFTKKDGSEGAAERGRVYPVAVLAADDAFVASDWSVANAGGSFAPEFSFDTASRLVSVKMNARGFMVIVR